MTIASATGFLLKRSAQDEALPSPDPAGRLMAALARRIDIALPELPDLLSIRQEEAQHLVEELRQKKQVVVVEHKSAAGLVYRVRRA